MSRNNQITVAMWDDVATAAASEFGEYERTGDDMRELTYNCDFGGMLRAADQFAWWVKQHIGRHEKSINLGFYSLRPNYVNEVVYGEDGDEDYSTGETSYRRVAIVVPENWTVRQKAALNAAIERAFNKQ